MFAIIGKVVESKVIKCAVLVSNQELSGTARNRHLIDHLHLSLIAH